MTNEIHGDRPMIRTTAPARSLLICSFAVAWFGPSATADEPKGGAAAPAQTAAKPRVPEAVEMAVAIVQGSQMGPRDGWFHAAELRYDWPWLAGKFDRDRDGQIRFDEFQGPEAAFDRLDRDRDGVIKADDLDWSEKTSYYQMSMMTSGQFRKLDGNADGRITRDEWVGFFDRASGSFGDLSGDDFREALSPFPPRPRMTAKAAKPSGPPPDAPTPLILLKGLARSEIGSPFEGPHVGDKAPDFTLKTQDGSETVTLSKLHGKPVVLVFGNITCGPFRVRYPNLDHMQRRYGDKVKFLAVYVREAHPTGGWRMESNDRAGVSFAQPPDFATRKAVAKEACSVLKTTMPLLVDEIDDRVGHAYSGMPSRLYVIDAEGKVAYKAGRGPFGFKPGEMEQALVMTLLDQESKKAAKTAAKP
jgi:thiol-disulfide isomerase/thioredoxin